MVGAVVGVQPFGGEGLSGTGPKAGGPLYLYRLLSHAARRRAGARGRAAGSGGAGRRAGVAAADRGVRPSTRCAPGRTGSRRGRRSAARRATRFAARSRGPAPRRELPGPTGERNVYTLLPREAVLCLADADADRLVQLAVVLAVGSRAVWPAATRRRSQRGCRRRCRRDRRWSADWRGRRRATSTPCCTRGDADRCARSSGRAARAARADRRRPGAAPGERRAHAAGAPGRRARAERQHRRGGRQREPDDDRLRRGPAPSRRGMRHPPQCRSDGGVARSRAWRATSNSLALPA